jgi:prevent-host-death family protein
MSMARLEATEARKGFSEAISRAAYGSDRIVIQRRGKPVAALVSMDDLRLLEALEDRLDIEAARKALADPKNRKRIPWERVKSGLGL